MAASSLVSPLLASLNSTTILNLPDELLVAIFMFLSRRDRLSLQLVCRRFLNVARDPGLWTCIVVRPACKTKWLPMKEAAFLAAVRRATMLRSLQCTNVVVQDTNALFSAVATSCPLIEKFCVPHNTVARRNVELLVGKCLNLTELFLNTRGPEDYDSIEQLKHLRSLRVTGSYWGYGIPVGQGMLLKQLAKKCVHLEQLHIDDASIDVVTLASIATEMAPRLTGLTLKISNSVETYMRVLDRFSALQDLTLKFHPDLCDPCFDLCSRLKDLTRLKIECEGVDQAHIYDLFGTNHFEQLRTLKLKKATYFDDAVIEVVCYEFAELEEVHIDGSLFIDNDAIHNFLINSPNLRVLKLSDLPDAVTSACLVGIPEHCEGLTHLKVKLCDRISKDDVKSIARQKPGLSAMILDRCATSTDRLCLWHHYCY